MQQKRALESSDQSLLRHINDSTRKAQNEPWKLKKNLQRKITDSEYQSNKRAMETSEETSCRRTSDQIHAAKKRASRSSLETLNRLEQDGIRTAKREPQRVDLKP